MLNAIVKIAMKRSLLVLALLSMCFQAHAQQHATETVLYAFGGGADGSQPLAGGVLDSAGNFYGTAALGGNSKCVHGGCGVVYKVSPAGVETVLYAFSRPDLGDQPTSTLLRDSSGNLYGTTSIGGDPNCLSYGCGAVFKVSATGTETTIYRFQGGTDGGYPTYAGVIADTSGDLYGATGIGGDTSCYSGFGCGILYRLARNGVKTTVYSFVGGNDGALPSGNLIRDPDGNVYGVTNNGGGGTLCGVTGPGGCGTVFKISPTGAEKILYRFTGGTDGSFPLAGLVWDSAGNLYGTTQNGGDLSCDNGFGCGTVFKLDPAGTETVLYSFTGGADGSVPTTGLLCDTAGNLYGTTSTGGVGYGVVFELSQSGTETVLYTFSGGTDGAYPFGGLVRDKAGNLYGTTDFGGSGFGVVFKITL
jgi:uncharacterized repeat protein (TIGR03803 family)